MPSDTFNPLQSTATGTSRQPADARICRESQYPGSSTHTGLPASRRTRVAVSSACWEPLVIMICAVSHRTARAARRYPPIASRNSMSPIGSPYWRALGPRLRQWRATTFDHTGNGKASMAGWLTLNGPHPRILGGR